MLSDRFQKGLKKQMISSIPDGPKFKCGVFGVVTGSGRGAAGDSVHPAHTPKVINTTGRLKLVDLPNLDWYDISARLKCTACGKVGWVDTRLDWRADHPG
ncbi:hypothetical protein [Bradyrhizobium erythrophlei]|uniref:hypothetical protein n=1 Tax=Bradyrhizobium erythrophlei TaxID=1437360 RepID=UPI001FCDB442|nr:hypothetical protein [Bradyrhizobium erythrophlei]